MFLLLIASYYFEQSSVTATNCEDPYNLTKVLLKSTSMADVQKNKGASNIVF